MNSTDGSVSSVMEEPPPASSKDSTQTETTTTKTRPRTESTAKKEAAEIVRKLSASQIQALAASPESLPVAVMPPQQRKPNGSEYPMSASIAESASRPLMAGQLQNEIQGHAQDQTPTSAAENHSDPLRPHQPNTAPLRSAADFRRRPASSRTLSTPPINRKTSSTTLGLIAPVSTRRNSYNPGPRPPPLNLSGSSNLPSVPQRAPMPPKAEDAQDAEHIESSPAPIQHSIPLPPMSLHTHLQLELAGVRPSPLYIYRHKSADAPYESSAVKFERLLNALIMPYYLESTLTFGALACLDAFLYTFSLLPMRFCIAIGVLVKWWAYIVWKEMKWVVGYVWQGIWRLWKRGRRGRSISRDAQSRTDGSQAPSEVDRSRSRPTENGHASPDATAGPMAENTPRHNANGALHPPKHAIARNTRTGYRHRRTKSIPSNLTSYHKADLLQGAVIICSSLALMNVDASRMYHFIRAQSAMKLYVIYNLLEVGDRLLAAIGQDILECLFSSETLSRNSFGRSKIILPFGMFILSLIYNVIHAICLFYQVITLNVAVNSYSNALLTLIMSNQFVEIKGSVFKKIEKENLFQLTCADVVERFQLWVMLLIIAMRNIVEVGGISVPGAGSEADGSALGSGPLHTASILPASFTIIPSWLMSGEVLSPFLIVIGSEMLVDWIKHAYINKFNSVKPRLYHRMLDIFCKDYYTNAFGAPALTRRIGLPLLPLSCLFIRASVQIYHMFLATRLPPPLSPTATTELSLESSTPSSPAMIAALDRLDSLIRNALGRAVYGYPYANPHVRPFWAFTSDDAIAMVTMIIVFFLAWVVLLLLKLVLGMALLKYARENYATVRMQELNINHKHPDKKENSYYQPGKRIGGWGHVEVGDERRRMIYADDPEGLKRMRERERKGEEASKKMVPGEDGLEKVSRYEMIAKRIW
ncbi:eukaryotic membrane protein family-domain-containing protein [Pseudomassariella vexata]|uniref:Eukaryotic membrane protein family-domain-containing protein n=1 Tax=Pseudomassariella vexata TaxID=1141098 RepID=A0A1Y2DRE9_9PEZI|nr:eukaryotic membrane protein family-domain-containing protein [Pseudomassariella vexata]ORY61676.1 eukaryotic membrane protein family-domain-containing protein [Pseudomassariella vexata]